MDQLEERILQIDQLKNASKRLQHCVNIPEIAPIEEKRSKQYGLRGSYSYLC